MKFVWAAAGGKVRHILEQRSIWVGTQKLRAWSSACGYGLPVGEGPDATTTGKPCARCVSIVAAWAARKNPCTVAGCIGGWVMHADGTLTPCECNADAKEMP